MLTSLKNNEFQVTTTNQFSYLPYQQNLHHYNSSNNNNNNGKANGQGPFARTSKLRQNFGKKSGNRPKSVDFEVLKSVENICRAQPTAYATTATGELIGQPVDSLQQHGLLRASQRERSIKDRLVGEWQSVHATRV